MTTDTDSSMIRASTRESRRDFMEIPPNILIISYIISIILGNVKKKVELLYIFLGSIPLNCREIDKRGAMCYTKYRKWKGEGYEKRTLLY
jgi:hypothetical protein